VTLLHEQFTTGPDETAISNLNTSFDFTSGSPVFDDARLLSYNPDTGFAARFTLSGAAKHGRFDGIDSAVVAGSHYVEWDSDQTGTRELIQVRTSGGVTIGSIARNSSQRIVCTDSTNSVVASSNIGTHTVGNDGAYRIDWIATVNPADANGGRWQYRICDVASADTNTPITPAYDSGAVLNFGTANIDRVYNGVPADTSLVGNLWIYDIRVEDGVSTFHDGLWVVAAPTVDSVWVKVAGVWCQGTIWVKVGGVWYEAPPAEA